MRIKINNLHRPSIMEVNCAELTNNGMSIIVQR